MSMQKLRLAYLVTHPIPYQAPLLRMVAAQPDIDFHAFFGTDFTTRPFVAGEFKQLIEWDGLPPLVGEDDALSALRAAHHAAAILSAKKRGIKVLLRDEATPISAARSGAKRFAKRVFFETLKRGVDAYLAIGELNERYYVENGVDPARVFSVPYAVDNDRFAAQAAEAAKSRAAFKRDLGIAEGRPIVLFVAKLIERKRPKLLLEAFAKVRANPALRDPVLAFAGDGPQRAELEALAAALPPGAVKFLGFKRQNELPACYDLCDAFVLPSGQEAWGLVVNEVMCAGKAVICSDMIGAAPDLCRPGENGAIFKTDDVDDLARALTEVLGDADRLAAYGTNSRAIVDRWSFREDVAGLRAALGALVPGRFAP